MKAAARAPRRSSSGSPSPPAAKTWPAIAAAQRLNLPHRELFVTLGHDGEAVALADRFTKTTDGVRCRLKLGHRGEELVRRGLTGLSAEISEDTGEIVGLALVGDGVPGFRSAQIILPDGRRRVTGGVSVTGGSVTIGPPRRPVVPEPARPGMAIRDTSAELYGPSPELEAARVRSWWENRRQSLTEAETDWEAVLREQGRRGLAELQRGC